MRLGSVKAAAADLAVTEAAISMHIAHLRRELGDRLFTRTAGGLTFTPGGLRLASRAAELLGLQDRTILEVRRAGSGRRLLRIAASSLFAEHAAPGLIELFARRAADLDVELSVHDPERFATLLTTRAVDVAIGPRPATVEPTTTGTHFLNYQVIAVVGADHPLAACTAGATELREQTWLLGPSGVGRTGMVPSVLRRLSVPDHNQRIFQSQAACVDEAKHGKGDRPRGRVRRGEGHRRRGSRPAGRPAPARPWLLEPPHPPRPRSPGGRRGIPTVRHHTPRDPGDAAGRGARG